MLLICSGPDTWHARKKAAELIAAFRKKHDLEGLSTENFPSIDFKKLLNQLGAPSLFSAKRLIRCDGLLAELKIADVRALAKRLKDDADQTILLSVEEDPPSAKVIEAFSEIQFFQYASPLLYGASFEKWCSQRARELEIAPHVAIEIARRTDGDTWFAEQELMKHSANPAAAFGDRESEDGTVFDLADRYLVQRPGWREAIAQAEDDQLVTVLVSQARSALRVVDRETEGIHPFVAKKLSQLRIASPGYRLLRAIRALIGTRQGLVNADESQTIL